MAQQMALAEAELQTQLQQLKQQGAQPVSDPHAKLAGQADDLECQARAFAAAHQLVSPAMALLQLAPPSHHIHQNPRACKSWGVDQELLRVFQQMRAAAAQQESGTWEFVALKPGLVSSSSSRTHVAQHSGKHGPFALCCRQPPHTAQLA
jgi:hypothetical protein